MIFFSGLMWKQNNNNIEELCMRCINSAQLPLSVGQAGQGNKC